MQKGPLPQGRGYLQGPLRYLPAQRDCEDKEDVESLLDSCLWAFWEQGQLVGYSPTPSTAISCVPEAEEQTTEPENPVPASACNLTPFQPRTRSKTTAFCSRRNKNTSTKATRSLWFYQKGKKKKMVPTSCLWKEPLIPLPGTVPMGGGEGSLLTQFLTSPRGLRAEMVGIGSNKEALFDQRKLMSSQKDQG